MADKLARGLSYIFAAFIVEGLIIEYRAGLASSSALRATEGLHETWGQQTNLENTLKDFAKYSCGGTLLSIVEYVQCTVLSDLWGLACSYTLTTP